MHDEKPFFMRDPWQYDPQRKPAPAPDEHLGFDTRALHSGFRPLQDVARFRSFVTSPFLYESMSNISLEKMRQLKSDSISSMNFNLVFSFIYAM